MDTSNRRVQRSVYRLLRTSDLAKMAGLSCSQVTQLARQDFFKELCKIKMRGNQRRFVCTKALEVWAATKRYKRYRRQVPRKWKYQRDDEARIIRGRPREPLHEELTEGCSEIIFWMKKTNIQKFNSKSLEKFEEVLRPIGDFYSYLKNFMELNPKWKSETDDGRSLSELEDALLARRLLWDDEPKRVERRAALRPSDPVESANTPLRPSE
jgi:hypothetical protein